MFTVDIFFYNAWFSHGLSLKYSFQIWQYFILPFLSACLTGGSAIDFPRLITADGLTGNEDGTGWVKPLS